MTTMKFLVKAAAVTALLAGAPLLAVAQTTQDPHHPTASQPAAPAMQAPAPSSAPGMAGQGDMMGGMSGAQGMMRMMTMMGMMGQDAGGMLKSGSCGLEITGMSMIDHVEGRIAFLRAELRITDTQSTAWNEFADALRSNAKMLGEARRAMMGQTAGAQMQPPTLARKLDAQERWLRARLEGITAINTAFGHLDAALSEDQKKAAEDLLAPHMGMMPVSMMRSGGTPK